jgi:hypothetical protein
MRTSENRKRTGLKRPLKSESCNVNDYTMRVLPQVAHLR